MVGVEVPLGPGVLAVTEALGLVVVDAVLAAEPVRRAVTEVLGLVAAPL